MPPRPDEVEGPLSPMPPRPDEVEGPLSPMSPRPDEFEGPERDELVAVVLEVTAAEE